MKMQLHLFPIDFAHRKLLTASVYIAIALLLPPASIATSFFFIHFNIRYFVVLRKTGMNLSLVLSLSSVAFLIKKGYA